MYMSLLVEILIGARKREKAQMLMFFPEIVLELGAREETGSSNS